MKILLAAGIVLFASCARAQTAVSTPLRIRPNAAATAGGELRICAAVATCAVYGRIAIGGPGTYLSIEGAGSSNGNIILQPGNVAAASSIYILATRSDTHTLQIQDSAASTSGKSVRLLTNTGTEYFSIVQGGDATNPGRVSAKSLTLTLLTGSSRLLGVDSSGNVLGLSLSGFANSSLSNVSSVAFSAHFLPGADNTYDSGSPSFQWKKGYFADVVAALSYKANGVTGATNSFAIENGAGTPCNITFQGGLFAGTTC